MTEGTPNKAGAVILWTMLCSIAYAVLRYHILGGVPWKDFPFFIFNKGMALGGFILLIFNFTLGPLRNIGVNVPVGWLNARKALGMTGFLLVLIHVLMSLLVFSPDIYTKLYQADGGLTLNGGLSMLGGVLAFVVLWAYNLSFQTSMKEDKGFIRFITSRRFLLFAMLLTLVHLFFMGYEGWLDPAGWHGSLPPISLVAFALFTVSYVINLIGRR